MSLFEMKLPDVGEGVAEAELVEWLVSVGDRVTPDTVVAEVLTDKATVEVSSPVTGEVAALHGEPGDVLAVGGTLIGIQTDTDTLEERSENNASTPDSDETSAPPDSGPAVLPPPDVSARSADRPTAAPAVRARAADLGLDLASIAGTGEGGRVVHADLDRMLLDRTPNSSARSAPSSPAADSDGRHVVPVRGVRRRIAERLSDAWSEIPHITYVDDVDVTELEQLRAALNARSEPHAQRLTILPFMARAVVLAVAELPEVNAHYDHPNETLTTFDAVDVGIATQTDDGLRVAVVRQAQRRTVADLAAEIGRVTGAARDGSATREDLGGSTITITSLGAIGGIVTTPILNPPEVAILGVNKMATRPVWRDGTFQPRQVLNLSSSFDHRIIDGWVAATFVQHVKRLLETPALLFVDDW